MSLHHPMKNKKEIMKMKELENKKELMEVEEEKVAGGKISPICLGGEGMEQKPEEPHDGGATGGW